MLLLQLFSLVSNFIDCQKLKYSLTFEFVVLIFGNYFSFNFCISLFTKFRGLMDSTTTTNTNEFTVTDKLYHIMLYRVWITEGKQDVHVVDIWPDVLIATCNGKVSWLDRNILPCKQIMNDYHQQDAAHWEISNVSWL